MASTNLGDQLITFRYQQEGTAEGFNKLLCGVLAEGIISGGELMKKTDSEIQISPMQLLIGDGNVTVHVQTRENITSVAINKNYPYIVASFNWSPSVNNFVSFEAKNFTQLSAMKNPIILGKGVFNGDTLGAEFDYTRRTKCPSSYYNDFFHDFGYPSFNVSPIENRGEEIGFIVGKGKAIINGKVVEKLAEQKILLTDSDTGYHKIIKNINDARIDIAVLMDDGTVRYIMGTEANVAEVKAPTYPSNGLVLAEFKYTTSINTNLGITGANIKNIYNNNYMSFSPKVGETKGTTDAYSNRLHQHRLYL